MPALQRFIEHAQLICGKKQVWTDKLRILSYGTDASFYQYLPKVVVDAQSESQVQQLLKLANETGVAVTFRAAGTSLSGQTISDSVIIQLQRENWKKFQVFADEKIIRMQPGLRGGEVNLILKKYKQQIGPDPASINSAMIGGMVANNASGMRSGVNYNAYNLLKDIRIVFSDGTFLDTSDKQSVSDFHKEKSEMIKAILGLKSEIESEPELVNKIQEKYSIKNTIGYGLNSLVDFSDPIEIIAHLMVGSEGTLGFISEVSLKTIPLEPISATGLMLFKNLDTACQAAIILNEHDASAIELIDRKALKAVEQNEGIPSYIRKLGDNVTALLVEYTANSGHELNDKTSIALDLLKQYDAVRPFSFTDKVEESVKLWNVRKGIFPAVGGNRKPGTTVFIEDVAFALPKLPDALRDLRSLLKKYEYTDAVIYGHANDGNVHFIFSEDMRVQANVDRYARFMDEVAELVVEKYNGSLKAEHGTGRNMAPFVKKEWGDELYEVHRKIKEIFDPQNILNPGVIINDDPHVHVKQIKYMPVTDPIVDKCIECGFCEVNCLTNEFSMSARQRIIAFREIQRLQEAKTSKKEIKKFSKIYLSTGVDTCAGDGLCSTSCPVGIDTGQIVKKLRGASTNSVQRFIAKRIANNMAGTVGLVRFALKLVYGVSKLIGFTTMHRVTKFKHRITGGLIPFWHRFMPKANRVKPVPVVFNGSRKVVYFPSCISQSMGVASCSTDKRSQTDVTMEVLKRAGYEIIFLEKMSSLCCGTPWESKGYFDIANQKSTELEIALLKVSDNGNIPVLFDTSPCLYRMRRVSDPRLRLYEPVEFALDFLVDKLKIEKVKQTVVLHSTCTTTKMGIRDKLLQLGNLLAQEAFIPENVGCCGFAGDKGFTQPEINTWALRELKDQLKPDNKGYSNSRTCEIGLSYNSGIEYRSIFYLLEEASKK